jgi:hypothetical protein
MEFGRRGKSFPLGLSLAVPADRFEREGTQAVRKLIERKTRKGRDGPLASANRGPTLHAEGVHRMEDVEGQD